MQIRIKENIPSFYVARRMNGVSYSIVIGRHFCFIVTPNKMYYNSPELPYDIRELLNCISCK